MRDPDSLSAAIAQRLRDLPAETPEPYGWETFRARALRKGRVSRDSRRSREWSGSADASRGPRRPHLRMAIAAMLLLALAGGITLWMGGGLPAPSGEDVAASHAARQLGAAAAALASFAPLVAPPRGSRELAGERVSRDGREEPALVRVGEYVAVAGLEEQLAQIDELMSAARAEGVRPTSLSPLERQRARLVSSLDQVRYAQTLASELSH